MATSFQLVGRQESAGDLIEKPKMTTIVYHGLEQTFAMDSMVTWTNGAKQHRIENSYKIDDLSKAGIVTCEGERLIAMCLSGSVNSFERCANFILDHLHKWEEKMKIVNDIGGSFGVQNTVGVILVTDKHTYVFRFNGQGVNVVKHKPEAFVAAGSGAIPAMTAHHVYGASALDAVKAAALIDEGSGYLVHALRIVDGKVSPNQPHYITDAKAEVMAMRKRAGKSQAYDMPKKTTEFANRYSHTDDARDKKLTKIREDQEKLRKEAEAKAAEKAAAEKAGKKGKRTQGRKAQEKQLTELTEKTTPVQPLGRRRGKAGPLPART